MIHVTVSSWFMQVSLRNYELQSMNEFMMWLEKAFSNFYKPKQLLTKEYKWVYEIEFLLNFLRIINPIKMPYILIYKGI